MVSPHGTCPGKMMASSLRSESAYRRNMSVRVHSTNISIAIWKIKVTQQGIFSFYISLLSFSPCRDRSNKGLRCLTSKFRHSNLLFRCHPTVERHTAERLLKFLQPPTSFRRQLKQGDDEVLCATSGPTSNVSSRSLT